MLRVVASCPSCFPCGIEFVTRWPHVGPLAVVPVIPGWAAPFLEACVSLCFCFRVLEEEGDQVLLAPQLTESPSAQLF